MVTRVWGLQGGTPKDDTFGGVAMGSDGSSVFAGYSNRNTTTEAVSGTVRVATKLDADGTVLWTWQDGPGTFWTDVVIAAAMGQDGCVVLAGMATNDFQVFKLDAGGSLEWNFEDGTDYTDSANAIAMGDDGSVVAAGATYGDWDGSNIGSADMAAFKLDADGILLWKWQSGSVHFDWATGIAMAEDGSVVIAGWSDGDFGGVNVGVYDDSSSPSPVERDFAAIKLDSEGNEVWRWQDGTGTGDNHLAEVVMTEDGSFVMAGSTDGVWSGVGSSGGLDFAAVKLDADGNEVWRWQGGTSEDEEAWGLTVQDDGTILLGGHTTGDWIGSNAGGSDFAIVALDDDGGEVWRWQEGSTASDMGYVYDFVEQLAAGPDGMIVLAGKTHGSYVTSNLGGYDFVAMMLDTSAMSPAISPTATPSPSPSTTASPSTPPSSPPTPTTAPNPMPAPTGTPSPAAMPDIPPPPTPASSDSTPIVAGVVSAVVGVALLITLGCFVRKRKIASRSHASRSGPLPGVVVDRGSGPPPLPPRPPLPPPSYAEVMAMAAADNSEEGRGIDRPFPDAFAGVVPPVAEATSGENKDGGDRGISLGPGHIRPLVHADNVGGVSGGGNGGSGGGFGGGGGGGGDIVADNIKPTIHAGKHGGFGLGFHQEYSAPTANAGKGGVGDGEDIVEGDTEPTTHGGKGGGFGVASGDEDSEQTAYAGKDGGFGVAVGEAYTNPTTTTGKGGGGGDGVEGAEGGTEPTTHAGKGGGGGAARERRDAVDGSAEPALIFTTSTAGISTADREEIMPAYGGGGVARTSFAADDPKPTFDEIGSSSSTSHRGPSGVLGLGQAVGEAAQEMARNCHIPGVSEAAAAVSLLVNLVTDNQDTKNGTEASLRRCRSIVIMLQRAAKVVGKGGDTAGKAERAMMEDVHDAIFDLVELIKTYQSKSRLHQLLTSTLFRRRQDEMGAVVDRAILGLQLGLHVQVGNDVSAVKQDVGAFKDSMHLHQGSIEEAQSKSLVAARTARRQRKLDQIEIPEEHVAITDELLGKGGFGEVFLADYNGRNAAAKVIYINHDIGRRGESEVLDGSTAGHLKKQREKSQHKAFLRELDAMIHLRSPHTINVYGAVTVMQDRLVLVMELLAGGDLRTLLSNREHPLPEEKSRQIIGDICAGMAFLHSKKAIHGDLKSANVLLDGAGRAKIGDFGTSRWTQHTMSTGLATFTTKTSKNTQMSLAWSAPEVLHAAASTYASDVYSFGIVVWEVLSRELPWATVTHHKDIYIHVVLNDLRPAIDDDAPTEIADLARACWVGEPEYRPTFSAIMEEMKSNRWNV